MKVNEMSELQWKPLSIKITKLDILQCKARFRVMSYVRNKQVSGNTDLVVTRLTLRITIEQSIEWNSSV